MRLAAAIAILFAAACGIRESPAAVTPAPTAAPAVLQAVAPTLVPPPELTWTPEPELVGHVIEVTIARPTELPAARPTVDVRAIPSMDSPRPTPARYRRDQLEACVTYDVTPEPGGQWARVKVTGRNRCTTTISADEGWFEVTAIGWQGGAQDREVGRFQQAILPFSSAETYIEVRCTQSPCRYRAAVWWAAGGGRVAE